MSDTRAPWPRRLALGALVLGVAAAGIVAGNYVRGNRAPVDLAAHAPTHGLPLGGRFPSVALVDEGGSPLVTDDLWRERGAVILFLDLECAPCGSMIERWQADAGSDSLAGLPLFGITHAAPGAVRDYRAARGLSFAVYSDTAGAFLGHHGVTDYPLCAIVGRSGRLQRTTFDPKEPLPAMELLSLLAR